MRRALDSIVRQSYDGELSVMIVFDQSEPDMSLESDGERRVTVITNNRKPGLSGGRNSGILALDTDVVAFCDDDDIWLEGKLIRQIERLVANPDAQFVTTAMRVDINGESVVRLAGREQVSHRDLLHSRFAMLHSSSFLFRRKAMVDGFGLVDETLPRSMAEDWDILLRASRRAPIEHVDEALIGVQWGQSSYFNDAWRDKNAARRWMLDRYPEFKDDNVGYGLMTGKLAFGHAALGERRSALRYAMRTIRLNWKEPRSYLALLVMAGVPAKFIVGQLNMRGHGI
jgi:glycosyltransferase involved in cell wall biosynthesis